MSTSSLNGKVALIVGASSGMGRATAKTFATAGARLAVASRNADALQALCSEIGSDCFACPTDVREATEVEALIKETLNHFGRIDILVYASGINIPDRSLERLTHETWDRMIATNLTGAFNCAKATLPVMRSQKGGLIIYISSVGAKTPDVSGVSYQAAKRGLDGLAHGAFVEEGQNGIRTSVIYPGLTDTPIIKQRPVPTPPEVLAKALQPQDVADACLYIASAPSRVRIAELVLQPSEL